MRSQPSVRHPQVRAGIALAAALLLVAAFSPQVALADFASVTVHFENQGDLPLFRAGGELDHGCWQTMPPGTIAAHSTVTWESVSCGTLTATEGSVLYQPFGTPTGVNARFYWDDLTFGSNTAENSAPSGCTSSQTNPPDSGLNFDITFTMSCVASTGDGIADVWKLNKAAFDPGGGVGPQTIDLPAMGARVGQKDIFLQVDWMQNTAISQKIDPAVIKTLVGTFAANGYALHVDEGSDSILDFSTNATWGGLSQAGPQTYQAGLGTATPDGKGGLTYDWTAFNAIKSASFVPTGRAPIFHYVLAAHQLGTATNSGISQAPGTDIIISLGAFTGGVGSITEQLGTLMHELGHNLGLGHGGGDSVNYKPNYFSVMNYAFQFGGVVRNGTTTYDYSHGGQGPLDETNLNEPSGLGAAAAGFNTQHFCPATATAAAARITVPDASAAIDWNCNGKTTDSGFGFDVNNDPEEPANTLGTLVDHNDWASLQLVSGAIGAFGADVATPPVTTTLDDPNPDMVRQIVPIDTTPPVTTAIAKPTPNAAGWNNTNVTVTLSATDNLSGVARTEFNLDGTGWTAYTSPVVISTDLIHTFQYRSTDRASNVETAKSLTVKLDETPPTVTYTGNLGTYGILATVSITCTASDNLSGVASTTCANITGPAYNFNPGTNTFSATATDVAGNVGSGSTSFSLVVTYADLCTLSKRFVTNAGVSLSNDMCSQLAAAQLAAAQGKLAAKANAIGAYLNDVNAAVSGHYLTAAKAAILRKLAGGL